MNKVYRYKVIPLFALTAIPLALAVALPSVQAEAIPAQGPIPFATYDANGDGSVTETEFNAIRAQRMESRAAAGRPMRGLANAPTFADFDKDANGKLTPAELTAGQQAQRQASPGAGMGRGAGMGVGGGSGMNPPAFADFDTNGDGCINAEEFSAGWGSRSTGNANGNMPTFADFDTDKDGYISEQELNTGRAQRITKRATEGRQMRNVANATPFADIDTNKDGKIDPAEFAAHQAQHRPQRP